MEPNSLVQAYNVACRNGVRGQLQIITIGRESWSARTSTGSFTHTAGFSLMVNERRLSAAHSSEVR